MEKSSPVVIYRCRRCGKVFQEKRTLNRGMQVNDVDVPVGPVYLYHLCNDGIYGLGDLIGGYEVKMNREYTSKESVEFGKCIIAGLTSGFEKVMNPPEDGFDGQANIEIDSNGIKWVYCPWCHKKHFPINKRAKIQGLRYQCRNSNCKRIFIVNI
ncbi:hypothetical protein [Lacrimispora sp.]|uniref:hypothetical protein n=1 Tax=Lacrimispora sp. TaxID=2719234 RepID=UPI0039965F69